MSDYQSYQVRTRVRAIKAGDVVRLTLDSGDGEEEFDREGAERVAREVAEIADDACLDSSPLSDAIWQVLAEIEAGAAEASAEAVETFHRYAPPDPG